MIHKDTYAHSKAQNMGEREEKKETEGATKLIGGEGQACFIIYSPHFQSDLWLSLLENVLD